MAKTPPNRSYRFFSGMVCWACAYALSAPAKATGAAVSARPATTLRLVRDVEESFAIGHSLIDGRPFKIAHFVDQSRCGDANERAPKYGALLRRRILTSSTQTPSQGGLRRCPQALIGG